MLDETGTEDEEPTGVEEGIIGVDVGRVTMGPEGLTGPFVGVAFSPVVGMLVLVEPPPTEGMEIGTPTLEHSVTTMLETAVGFVSMDDNVVKIYAEFGCMMEACD